MLINRPRSSSKYHIGVTLIEMMVFIVVVSIALGALLQVFNGSVMQTVDPLVRIKSLEKAQALMDQILVRKFDENTPTGGIPACGSSDGIACLGITADSDYDDVGDYNGYSDNSDAGFPVAVSVVEAGTDLGLLNAQARRITVVISMPDGKSVTLSSYKANF